MKGFIVILLVGLLAIAMAVSVQGAAPVPSTATPVVPPGVLLTGKVWTLAALRAPGAEKPVLAGTTVTLSFNADGRVTGSAGCNNFTGGYSVDGARLAIGALASTKKYCGEPQGLMEQESGFLAALAEAKSFQVQGGQLVLFSASGAQVMRLQGT